MTLIPSVNKKGSSKYFYRNSIVLAQGGDFRIQLETCGRGYHPTASRIACGRIQYWLSGRESQHG